MNARPRRRGALIAAAVLALMPTASAEPTAGSPEETIRQALTDWMLAFNAGDTGTICGLFAPDLRYDYRGFPERGFEDVCGLLHGSLADRSRKYTYDLAIKEIIVSGDLAAVRLTWTLTVQASGAGGRHHQRRARPRHLPQASRRQLEDRALHRLRGVVTAPEAAPGTGVCTSHITTVSVATETSVPNSTTLEACSIQVSYWRANT